MKPCSKCGENPRTSYHSYCKPCRAAYARQDDQKRRRNEYNKNSSCVKKQKKRYLKTPEGRATAMLYNSTSRANRKGLEHDLDLNWIVERMRLPCPVTGRTFVLETGETDTRVHPNAPSIDRLDNDKGYTKDNCRVVVHQYNLARNVYSEQEVVDLCVDVLRTISSQASADKAVEGSTTIPLQGVGPSGPKRATASQEEVDDMVSSALQNVAAKMAVKA